MLTAVISLCGALTLSAAASYAPPAEASQTGRPAVTRPADLPPLDAEWLKAHTLAIDNARDGGAVQGAAIEAATAGSSQPSSAQAALTTELEALRDRVRKVLAMHYLRPVNSRDHSAWEVMHWIIAYNVDSQVLAEGPWGEPTTAVGWLCVNRPCRGERLLGTEEGRLVGLRGPGLQGHDGQFLAILAQSLVPREYQIRVGQQEFSVADLAESEKLGCRSGTELTFKLIGLMHYLKSDETWQNSAGEPWSIPRLVREEIAKPIHGAACGGTHRLMGISYAVRTREARGQTVDGEYLRAKVYMHDYHRYALGLANPDGSFSTAWFTGREARPDVERRVQTSGHILEWLAWSLSEEELLDPRMVKAVDYLTGVLLAGEQRQWNVGHLGHALRGLSLYDRRVFKPHEPATANAGR